MRILISKMNSNPVKNQSPRVSILWICLVLLFVSFFQYFDVLHWSVLTPWGPDLANCSIRPHDTSLFLAQFFGPFLHGNLEHFLGNFTSLVVLSILFIVLFPNRWLMFWVLQHILSIVLLWLIGSPHTSHIGASLWVYAFSFFLITTGVIHRDKATLSVMFMVFVWMGGFIWGLLPIDPKVSWEGHIAGSIAGVVLALSLGLRWRRKQPAKLQAPDDPYMQFDVNQEA